MAVAEAAHDVALCNPVIQRFYQRRQNRVHKRVTTITMANKLAKAWLNGIHLKIKGLQRDCKTDPAIDEAVFPALA